MKQTSTKRMLMILTATFFAIMIAWFLSQTGMQVNAATLDKNSKTWSENSEIDTDVTIDGGVTVDANITLKIPEGKTLIVNGGINANDKTLTVEGEGKLIIRGSNGSRHNGSGGNGGRGGNGFTGNLVVNGTDITVSGGHGSDGRSGYGGNGGGDGGNGGHGIDGDLTVNSGSANVSGGSGGNGGRGGLGLGGGRGGNGGDGGHGGDGIDGDLTVKSGSADVSGGNGGNGGDGSNGGNGGNSGSNAQAVTSTITATTIEESDDNSKWSPISSGNSSTKQYVKAEAFLAVISTAPTAQNLIYDSSEQELVTPGQASGGTMKYALGIGTDTAPDNSEYDESIPTAADAATYYVWYKVFGDATHSDSAAACLSVTIYPATSSGKVEKHKESLTYKGTPQNLIRTGSAQGGTLQFALGDDPSTPPEDGLFAKEIPKGTDAGDYYVWFRLKGDTNHCDIPPLCLTVNIQKATITPSVSITGWTYGDTPNSPNLSEGSNPGNGDVTYQYSKQENDGYTPQVPDEAGPYYVRTFIAETKNYKEAVSKPLGFTINRKSATITAADQTIKEGESIETGIDKASLSDALTDHSLSAVTLTAEGDKITSSDAEIRDAAGKDVTNNYKISYQPGTLTVIKKISQTVTFRVVNGSWNDGSKDDKTVTLEGHEGDILKLQSSDIPEAGDNPDDNYRAGGWDTAPDTETAISEDTTYTYSYIKKDPEPVPEEKKSSAPLLVKMIAKGKKNLKLSWTGVQGAEGYDIFFSRCNHGKRHMTVKQIHTVKAGAPLTWVQKGLRKHSAYKARVKAYVVRNGKKQYIKTSPAVHAYTSGYSGKYTNPKSVKVNRKALSLTPGKTVRIKAKVIKLKKGKRLMPAEHAVKLRYLTTNTDVATVSRSGRITAKGKGSCKVYVIAVNGASKAVSVTVK